MAGSSEAEEVLVEQAREYVGAPAQQGRTARDPVNPTMINHWVDALDDRNPVYTDPVAAAQSRHGGIIAPPAMLGSWTLDGSAGAAGVWAARGQAGGDGPAKGPRDHVLRRLEEAGYTAVVATNYEHVYHRALRPGDRLSETLSVEELSERKDTALGTGYFVTVRHDYVDAGGELVGTARMRLLKFRPPQRPAAGAVTDESRPAASRPRPPVNRDNAFFWEGVGRGELLIQRCAGCGLLRHPPRPMCPRCRSTDSDTVVASGRGTVYSYVVHHHPPLPGMQLPFAVVLVDLEEGVRFVAGYDGDPDQVRIGMPVTVVFEQVADDLTLPAFRPLDPVPA